MGRWKKKDNITIKMFLLWGFFQSFTKSMTSRIQRKRHYNQWHHHLITLNSSRQAAGDRGWDGWLACLWRRSGGWMLFGLHDYNRALYSMSLSCWLSLFRTVHFFLLMMSFPCWARLQRTPEERGWGWLSVRITEESVRKGGGRELNREQRRRENQPCAHDKQLSHGGCDGVWGTNCINHSWWLIVLMSLLLNSGLHL